MVRLYHGTCASKLPSIQEHGLRPPVYLTSEPRVAALVAADPDWCEDGDPMILSVELTEEEARRLEPDFAMLRHPMHGFHDNEARARLLRLPEAEVRGRDTLDVVQSAVYPKRIPGERLDVYPRGSGKALAWGLRQHGFRRPVRQYRRSC